MYTLESIDRSESTTTATQPTPHQARSRAGRVSHTSRFASLAAAVVFAISSFAMLATSSTAQAQGSAPAYRLDSGDKVKVTVFGHEDLSGEFEVDPQGKVSMPLIQTVQAQGLTPQEFESEIVGALQPDYLKNPTVTVEVLTSKPFYILGEVEEPGSYDYVSGLTILESVALAGGFTYRAKQKKMTIVRATDPEKRKIPATVETRVLPGDVIEIPERRW